jgi:hypothetical protein
MGRAHLVDQGPTPLELAQRITDQQTLIRGLERRILDLERLDRRSWPERAWRRLLRVIRDWMDHHGL